MTQPRASAIAPPSPEAREAARTRLTPAQKARFAWEVVSTYVRARVWLRRYEIAEAVRLIRGGWKTQPPTGSQLLEAVRLARIVRRTLGALPADSRCLVRSLVLSALLARRGIEATLVIGVRSEPRFESHAWVECGGYALLPTGNGDYARLLEL
jgi:hypothetical protein